MSTYRVEVCKSPEWRRHKTATLGVSVPSPNWGDEKFAAILSFAARNFEIIRIDVTDALYRHNFMAEGHSPEQALAQANAFGALWLTRHQDIIEACPIKSQIVRWGEWYQHPDYEATLAAFQRAHEINYDLREAVSRDVSEFYQRKGVTPSLLEAEHSRNFMIEEMAIITMQARLFPSLRIYPGSELTCMNLVRCGLVPEAPRGLEFEQFAKIRLEKKRGGFVPRESHGRSQGFGKTI